MTFEEKDLVAMLQKSIDSYNKAIEENDKIERDHRLEQFTHWRTMVETLTGKSVHYSEETHKVYLRR